MASPKVKKPRSRLPQSGTQALKTARRVLATEQAGLAMLAASLGKDFTAAARRLQDCSGRIIVTGIGKSGHVARKIASTLASTGTRALYVHPSEASHGDLGMIASEDVILMLSWSGKTPELSDMINYAKRFAVGLIAMTSEKDSLLARSADAVLLLPQAEEACPNGLAPTTSTTMQLALGDALAMVLLESRGFSPQDFRALHPGGKLGASLIAAKELMHEGAAMPLVTTSTPMREALLVMTEKGLGCLGVTDKNQHLVGIITDGDLRRNMSSKLLQQKASDLMTRRPKTIPPDMLAGAALHFMTSNKIQGLFVTQKRRAIGFIHLHDLLRIGAA